MKLSPLTELTKKTSFLFVEDEDDYAFNMYKNSAQGHLYGSSMYDASGFTLLQGETEISADPFAATVVKPLMSQFGDFIVPSLYSYDPSDGTSSSFENSPRILFNNGLQNLASCTYEIPAQNTVAGIAAEDEFLI